MKIKAGVFDRIEQSFILFKQNFLSLFLPIFIYQSISILVGIFMAYFFYSNLGNINEGSSMDIFNFLNDPFIVMSIVIGSTLFLLYLVLYIVVLIATIRSIKNIVESEKIDLKQNLSYGLNNLFNSFKTYWYIFVYVALIPALIFILGGALFNGAYFYGLSENLKQSGVILMGLGVLLFIVFAIYRGIKATFPIYMAVDNDNYSKHSFEVALSITENNWWRIVGNILLIGLLMSLLSGLVSGIISLFSYSSIDFNSIKTLDDFIAIAGNFSILGEFISSFINGIVGTILAVFSIIFTYLFYLRLFREKDYLENSDNKIQEEVSEIKEENTKKDIEL